MGGGPGNGEGGGDGSLGRCSLQRSPQALSNEPYPSCHPWDPPSQNSDPRGSQARAGARIGRDDAPAWATRPRNAVHVPRRPHPTTLGSQTCPTPTPNPTLL